MVEVTQADRTRAADILDEIASLTQHDGIGQVADLIRDGEYDEHDTVQQVARHRIAERERNAEKCDERAALYRAKAGKRDALADDSLNEYERFIGYAEVVDIAAQAIRAASDD